MLSVGERVFARWPQERSWWYPGVVVGVDREYEIQFDDGDRCFVPFAEAKPLAVNTGTKIQCRWKGGGAFYEGTISAVRGSAIDINYDDGDREVSSVSMLRIVDTNVP